MLNKGHDGGWRVSLIDWEACGVLSVGADPALMLYYHFRNQMRQSPHEISQSSWGGVTDGVIQEYIAGLCAAGVETDFVRHGCLEMLRRLMRLEICSMFMGHLWITPQNEDGVLMRERPGWCGHRINHSLEWMHAVVDAFSRLPEG